MIKVILKILILYKFVCNRRYNNTRLFVIENMNRVMRKFAFCLCENKNADHLRSNCAAEQRLYYNPPTYLIRNFKPLAIFCRFTARFVSDLVGTSEDSYLASRLISSIFARRCNGLHFTNNGVGDTEGNFSLVARNVHANDGSQFAMYPVGVFRLNENLTALPVSITITTTTMIIIIIIIIMIIFSIFTEDNVFSMIASLPYGPPVKTDIDYFQTFLSDFLFFVSVARLAVRYLLGEEKPVLAL